MFALCKLSSCLIVLTFSISTSFADLSSLKETADEAIKRVAALELVHPETTDVKIVQLFKRLQDAPGAEVDIEALRKLGALKMASDLEIRAVAHALYVLSLAADPTPRRLIAERKVFATTYPDNMLYQRLDIQSLLMTCHECQGDNRATKPCKACKNSGKCSRCKGSGKMRKPASLSSSNRLGVTKDAYTTCTACKGKKVCSACKGDPRSCSTCGNTGRIINLTTLNARIGELAGQGLKLVEPLTATWFTIEKDTAHLAETMRSIQTQQDSKTAQDELEVALRNYSQALQFNEAKQALDALRAIETYKAENATEIIIPRQNITIAIRMAQSRANPNDGIEWLKKAMAANPTADNLDVAQAALNGIILKRQEIRETQTAQIERAFERIKQIEDKEIAIAQLALLISDNDAENLPAVLNVKRYHDDLIHAQSQSNEGILRILIFAGGALVVFLIGYAIVSSIITKQKEAARKKRRANMKIPSHMNIPSSDPFAKKR